MIELTTKIKTAESRIGSHSASIPTMNPPCTKKDRRPIGAACQENLELAALDIVGCSWILGILLRSRRPRLRDPDQYPSRVVGVIALGKLVAQARERVCHSWARLAGCW